MTNKKNLLHKQIESMLTNILPDFGGGCSLFKAKLLAKLIIDNNLKSSIDIGVYRGRSLFPQSFAHKLTGGVVYGVDPYTNESAIQVDREDIKDELLQFALNTDFEKIYKQVYGYITEFELEAHTVLVRKKSEDAVSYFNDNKIFADLIHIDGNHDEKAVTSDYNNYLPLLNNSGFLVLDDISWGPVQTVYKRANSELLKLYQKIDKENDFAIFCKTSNNLKFKKMKLDCFFSTISLK